MGRALRFRARRRAAGEFGEAQLESRRSRRKHRRTECARTGAGTMRRLFLVTRATALLALALCSAAQASDILSGRVRLPDPASTPSTSYASISPLHFQRAANGVWTAELSLPVE